MIRKYTAHPVLGAHAELGEGPVWDPEKQVLYWVDIVRGQIHCFDPESGLDDCLSTGKTAGCIALRKGGGLAAALADGFYTAEEPETSRISDLCLRPFALPHYRLPSQRFNDGKCDPAGRFWAGTMDLGQKTPQCALYCLETDGACRTMVRGIGCSNGLAWSADARVLYYIDTVTHRLDAFDFDVETGNLSDRRAVVDFDSREACTQGSPPAGIPDGMTVDAEGMLWIAEWQGYKVSRWDPRTGRKIGEVSIPVSKVTSCTFGGPDLTQLYITTAAEGLTADERRDQPDCGNLFCVETDTKGLPPARFGG